MIGTAPHYAIPDPVLSFYRDEAFLFTHITFCSFFLDYFLRFQADVAHLATPLQHIIIFAILNSGLANGNAGVNAGSRVMYAMGRIRTIPALLGQTNRHRTPGKAIVLMMVVGSILTLWLGLVYGPTTAFALVRNYSREKH